MATTQHDAVAAPPAKVVGDDFVKQYYPILHQSPELAHRFYHDESKLGRPDPRGAMSSTTTTMAIKEKILSMGYSKVKAEINTVDAQESLLGGVTVLVTGYLVGVDDSKRNFTQSFFLAKEEKGYFVLNDQFRYVEEPDHPLGDQILSNGKIETPLLDDDIESPLPEQELSEQSVPPPEVKQEHNEEEVSNPSDNGEDLVVGEEKPVIEVTDLVVGEEKPENEVTGLVVDEEKPVLEVTNLVVDEDKLVLEVTGLVVDEEKPVLEVTDLVVDEEKPVLEVTDLVASEEKPVLEVTDLVASEEKPVLEVTDGVPNISPVPVDDSDSTSVQGEAPRKSYASIVKLMKENTAPLSVPLRSSCRPSSSKPNRQVACAHAPDAAFQVPIVNSISTRSNSVQKTEADCCSIYVSNLPLDATPAQLEEEFKRFGPIKPGGILVRSMKQEGFCFGFVEFKVPSAVQSALEASPLMIGRKKAYIEVKRHTGSRVNNRGSFLPRREGGGYHNDGKGRGSHNGGRGYGRAYYISKDDGRAGSLNNRVVGQCQQVDPTVTKSVLGNGGPIVSPKEFSPQAAPAPQ